MSEKDERLATERFRLLIGQLRADGSSQTTVAKRMGISQATVSKILRGERQAGASITERVCRQLALDRRFFYDEGLRPLDWAKHRRVPADKSSTGEDRSVHKAVETFLRQEGPRVSPEHAAELRGVFFGAQEPTVDMIRAIWREMLARDARLPRRPKRGKRG